VTINKIVDHRGVGINTDQRLNEEIGNEGKTPLIPLTLAVKEGIADAHEGCLVEYCEVFGEVA